MRLDYTLYVLAALLLIITVVPFVVTIEGIESETPRSLWVVTTVVLGLLSIGLGYSQRPKTEAQACQTAAISPEVTVPQTQPAATMETPTMTEALELTQVKGIGEKRATQLKVIGINNVNDLAKASAEDIAKKLQISLKITKKWIDSAKALVK
jgi:predicted flap endonuclease-1-like 5' DNA nuclease